MNSFVQRLLFGSIAVLIVLTAIYFSYYPFFGPIFTLIVALVIGSAIWEYYQLAIVKGYKPLRTLGIGFSILYIYSVYFSTQYEVASPMPVIVLGTALLAGFLHDFWKGNTPIVNLAITIFGIVYLAIPLSCIIDITFGYENLTMKDGRVWIFYLIAVTKSMDIGAFITGKLLGQHKLAPGISPKKTWEGAIGGFLAALLVSYLFYLFSMNLGIQLPFWHSVVLGGIIAILAQLGDLSESLLKRDAGIKDSNKLPGLGGILDVVDSLVFTTPFLCLYLKLI